MKEAVSLAMHVSPRMVEIGENTYRMDFDMQALSVAERVYKEKYHVRSNVGHVLAELSQGSLAALMAITYGAIVSGGEKMTWETFSKEVFTWEYFDALYDQVSTAVCEMMGFDEAAAGGEQANEKN